MNGPIQTQIFKYQHKQIICCVHECTTEINKMDASVENTLNLYFKELFNTDIKLKYKMVPTNVNKSRVIVHNKEALADYPFRHRNCQGFTDEDENKMNYFYFNCTKQILNSKCASRHPRKYNSISKKLIATNLRCGYVLIKV